MCVPLQSEQQQICVPGVTCSHVDFQLLLTRVRKCCFASPSHQIFCLGPQPGCCAMVCRSQKGGGQSWAGLDAQTFSEAFQKICNCRLPA